MNAHDRYMGKPYGDEKPGQSRVVTRETLDAVEWILPSLLEIFASTDETVRFDPVGPEDVPFAEQATDYCNYVWSKDNPGFLSMHTWFKDALINSLGVLKIWWEDDEEVKTAGFEGLDDSQLQMIMDDPSIEILGVDPSDQASGLAEEGQAALPAPQPDPAMSEGMPAPVPPAPTFWNVSLRWTEPRGKVCVEPVPPEEYVFLSSVKRDTDPGQGHIRRITQGDLIAQGFDQDIVDDLPTADGDDNGERGHRFDPAFGDDDITRSTTDRASRFVTVTEWYTRIDLDGDGVAENVMVTLGGDTNGKVLRVEEYDGPPFAVLSPILMPHRLAGLSVAELVMDLQEIKSSLTRQMLNSLYLSNNPRVWAVDGQVNLDDLLTHRPGGVVRMRQPGMVGELNTTYVGAQAFPFLEYIDRTLEGRTGVSRMMQGIDADALHGGNKAMQTATGVAALQSAAQQRVALIARVFAETGVKKAFRLILQLVTKYQDQQRVVRLRNQWVPVDPRAWNSEMDCSIEVGLGSGNKAEQTAHLGNILAIQQQLMQVGGMGMVTPKEIHNTLAKMVQLAGLKQVDAYFADPSQAMQQPPQPPPPDPNLMLVQVQAQVEQGKLELEREKMLRADDRERDKLDAEISLKAAELQSRYGAQVNVAAIRADVERDREAMRQQAQVAQASAGQGPVRGMQPRPNGPVQ
jgi:hypothetical protein